MPTWSYTFCDLLSGRELATLPVSGVSFASGLSEVGPFAGFVPTLDPQVRELDPWAATQPRRTCLYVECDDQVVWGGIVWGRSRSHDEYGLRITAASFDSWLAFLYLRADVNLTNAQLGTRSSISLLLSQAQSYAGANIGLATPGGDGTGEVRLDGILYSATDVKSMAERLESFATDNGSQPVEWRIDLGKVNGKFTRTLTVADEPLTGRLVLDSDGIYRVFPEPPLELHYPGQLLSWTDEEEGSTQGNAVVGAASGAAGLKVFSAFSAPDVGSDELAAGYPLQTTSHSLGGANVTQAALDRNTKASLVQKLVQGRSLSNIAVRAHEPRLGDYAPGWTADLYITHPAYREWPELVAYRGQRIVRRAVTVGEGKTPDTVKLTVVPPTGVLPRSVTLTAQLRSMLGRLKKLETPS